MKNIANYEILPPNPYAHFNDLLDKLIEPAFNITLLREIDASSMQSLRERFVAAGTRAPTYTALIARAAGNALAAHPYANRVLLRGLFGPRLVQFKQANVAIGVALDAPDMEQAAYVANLDAVDRMSLEQIGENLRSFAPSEPVACEYLKQNQLIVRWVPQLLWLLRLLTPWSRYFARLWLSWCRSALIISSPGKLGADAIFCAWPWPIGLSFGKIRPRPFEVEGKLRLRPTVKLTLVVDRRIMAGIAATRFFNTLCDGLGAELDSKIPNLNPQPFRETKSEPVHPVC